MSQNLHKPKHLQSNVPYKEGNLITQEIISDTKIIVTEHWLKAPLKKWTIRGTPIAAKGYAWVTVWELGKNYLTTKFINATGNLVGYYWDITSEVKKSGSIFEIYDWYLDVWLVPGEKPVLLDEDEFTDAIKAKYLNQKEATLAKKTADETMNRAILGLYFEEMLGKMLISR